MKILVLSDLHIELTPFSVARDTDADIVVLAGDIHSPGSKAVYWCKRLSTFGNRPVVLVPGNHEFYRRALGHELAAMRSAAIGSNVNVLDRDVVVIDRVRFVGATLWTDFKLPYTQSSGVIEADIEGALAAANRRMNDFRLIDWVEPLDERGRQRRRRFLAQDAMVLHHIARNWLELQLAIPHHGRTVVITHHAPSAGSVHAKYAGDRLTPAFVSELPDTIFRGVDLWIHGHTHSPTDHYRGECRVVSNPRGYLQKDGSYENLHFDSKLVIEI